MRKEILMVCLFISSIFLASISCFSQKGPLTLGDENAIVNDLTSVPGKDWIAASSLDWVQVWDYNKKSLVMSWQVSNILTIRAKNNNLAGVSKDGNLYIWNLVSGQQIIKAKITNSPLISLSWNDSTFLFIGSDDGQIIKFDLMSSKIETIEKTDQPITALACIEGTLMFSGNSKGKLTSRNVVDLSKEFSYGGHRNWIRTIKVARDGKFFVSAGDDEYLKWWKIGQLDVPRMKIRVKGWITCADYEKLEKEVTALGTSNGDVQIVTTFGKYRHHFKSMINAVILLRKDSPQIELAVATHGQGIKLIEAIGMKFNESK